jgi:putative acetyltransferase
MAADPAGTVTVAAEPFEKDDVQAMLDAMADELDARYGEGDPGYRTEVDATELAPPGGAFLVARLDGRAVGCGAVRVSSVAGVAEVKRMYVRPELRGRGISRLLLAALEQAARDLGYRAVRLETGDPQHEAVALYESSGYRRIPPYGRYADSAVTRCYEKPLGRP